MTGLLDWLGTLPSPLLYLAIAVAAFTENIFPPLPADTAVALGAFVAARGNGTAIGAWAATMIGNIGGAMLMYMLGRRFGLPWMTRKFPALIGDGGVEAFQERYRKYGIWGIMISRFLPGVRAIVPPLAGAFHIGMLRAAAAMSLASGIWYAIVCILAFRAGANADVLLAAIARSQKTAGLIALCVVVVLGGAWWFKRRSRRDHEHSKPRHKTTDKQRDSHSDAPNND